MVALPSCACVVPSENREGIGFSGMGVTDAFELPWVGAGNGTPDLVEE